MWERVISLHGVFRDMLETSLFKVPQAALGANSFPVFAGVRFQTTRHAVMVQPFAELVGTL